MGINLKKLLSIFIIISIMLTPSFTLAYQPDTSNMNLSKIASVDFSNNQLQNAEYFGGRIVNESLLIWAKNGESSSVNIDVLYETSNKNCYADITYLDSGNMLFAVSYINSKSQGVQSEITEGNKSGEYVTKRIYLPDFCTNDGIDLTIKASLTKPLVIAGEDPVYIKSVDIYTDEKETVNIKALSDKPGNIFYDGEAVSFDISFSGVTKKVKNLDVKCNIYKYETDLTQNLYKSSEFNVTLDGATPVNYPVLLEADDFALYTIEIIALSDEAYGYTKADFSKSLINRDGNSSLGSCVHLVRFGDVDAELRLIKNAGFSTIRDDFTWWEYENVKGEKKLSSRQKKLLELCAEYEIEPLMIVYGNNKLYDATNSDLVSDEYMDEFKNFVLSAVSLDEFDIVKRIEVWNEPSSTHTLGGEDVYSDFEKKGEQYAKILTAAYDVIKNIRPDIEVGALSLSGMDSNNATTFVNSAMKYLKDNFDYQPFDAVSYHPYLFDYYPEYAQNEIYEKNSIINGYGFENFDIWHTEYGYSTGNPAFVREFNAKTQIEQATLTIRKYAALKSQNNSCTSWIYDFADDSIRNNVENASHGLVNSRHSTTPYSAKLSYLAICALNRLCGNALSCTEQVLENNRIYTFTCPERNVYLMYNTQNEEELINFDILDDDVYYYDIFGNELNQEDIVENGRYKLSDIPFYVVTGEKIINQPIDDSKIDMPVMNISGSITSKLPDKNISVVVLNNTDVLSGDNILSAMYVDQQKTGIQGVFDFNVRFENAGEMKAYIISEDSKFPIGINLNSVDGIEAVNLTSGMIKISDQNISMLNVKDMSVLVNREYIKEATDYTIVMTLYNYNELVFVGLGTDCKKDVLDSSVKEYKFLCDDVKEYDKIKIFVVNSLSKLEPLLDARIYSN